MPSNRIKRHDSELWAGIVSLRKAIKKRDRELRDLTKKIGRRDARIMKLLLSGLR